MGDEPDADRRLHAQIRAVRAPARGRRAGPAGRRLSKSATSRRFVALSAARFSNISTRLDHLDLMVIQIDAVHMADDLLLVAAIGIDATRKSIRSALSRRDGKCGDARALIANLIYRGLYPAVPRLFIIYGSKALSTAILRAFGRDAPIQRCQVHKARNILERLPKSMHASVRSVLRQVWELDDAAKAEKLLRNLARRLAAHWDGVASSILEALHEMLTVTRLGLPPNCDARWLHKQYLEFLASIYEAAETSITGARCPWRCAGQPLRDRGQEGLPAIESPQQLPALRAALIERNPPSLSHLLLKSTSRIALNQQRPFREFQHRAGHPRRKEKGALHRRA